jgi:hypothetical protein
MAKFIFPEESLPTFQGRGAAILFALGFSIPTKPKPTLLASCATSTKRNSPPNPALQPLQRKVLHQRRYLLLLNASLKTNSLSLASFAARIRTGLLPLTGAALRMFRMTVSLTTHTCGSTLCVVGGLACDDFVGYQFSCCRQQRSSYRRSPAWILPKPPLTRRMLR